MDVIGSIDKAVFQTKMDSYQYVNNGIFLFRVQYNHEKAG